jgi:putative hydrolase of the HAD superfamily
VTTAKAPAARPFDAVLCDIDNVIRFYDHTELAGLERAAGLERGATARVAFSDGVDGPLLLGRVGKAEWTVEVARGLAGQVPPEVARGFAETLAQSPTRADETVLELLLAAQRHLPVVLATNASLELDAELAPLRFAEHFADRIVNSARVGFAKPDPRIYALAAEVAGVEASRSLFVDDRPENVDAATALGMTGLHYREPADLRTALACVLEGTGLSR